MFGKLDPGTALPALVSADGPLFVARFRLDRPKREPAEAFRTNTKQPWLHRLVEQGISVASSRFALG